eukprot:6203139-Pleurochrysis_carterae.AAC.2
MQTFPLTLCARCSCLPLHNVPGGQPASREATARDLAASWARYVWARPRAQPEQHHHAGSAEICAPKILCAMLFRGIFASAPYQMLKPWKRGW